MFFPELSSKANSDWIAQQSDTPLWIRDSAAATNSAGSLSQVYKGACLVPIKKELFKMTINDQILLWIWDHNSSKGVSLLSKYWYMKVEILLDFRLNVLLIELDFVSIGWLNLFSIKV